VGLRIIDRRERIALHKQEELRRSLVEQEAERFQQLKGGSETDAVRQAFIDKVNNIRKFVGGVRSAQVIAEHLEEALRNEKGTASAIQGRIELSVALDLL
jgi:hypothetical protein